MRRRAVLATIPPLLAGCGGRSTEPHDTPNDSPTAPPGESPTDTPTETSTEAPTESPPPWAEFDLLELDRPTLSESEVQSRLDDRDCTELDDALTCPGDDGRVTISLSQSVTSLPDGEVEVSIRNDADEPYKWNPYAWKFWTFDGRSWRRLAPVWWAQPLDRIDPGGSHTYTVHVDDGPFEDLAVRADPRTIGFHGLGPGVYGFVNDSGYFGDREDDPVAVGATFGLAGQAQPLRPTSAVERVERDGSELVVESPTDEETWELLVTFVEGADADLLPDQVRMVEAFRNTVSFAPAEGIDAVRYLADPEAVNTAYYYLSTWTPDDATSLGIGDYAFEIERTEGV